MTEEVIWRIFAFIGRHPFATIISVCGLPVMNEIRKIVAAELLKLFALG